MKLIRLLLTVLLTITAVFSAEGVVVVNEDLFADVTRGGLRVVKPNGEVVECPLKHSAYVVDIAGPVDRKSTRLNSSHPVSSRMPSSA